MGARAAGERRRTALAAGQGAGGGPGRPDQQPGRRPRSRRSRPTPPKLTAGADGFVLQSASGDYRLQLRGYVHFDGRFFPSDEAKAGRGQLPPAPRAADLRRARWAATSTSRSCRTSAAGTTVLQDAWLDVQLLAEGSACASGKFKSPVGLERLQSATAHHLRRARLPDRARPEPRRGRAAPRRARGRRRRLRGRPLRRRPRRRQRRPRPRTTARTWPAASSSRPSSAGSRRSRASASGSPAPPASRRAPCRPTARGGQVSLLTHRHGHHRRRHAQPPLAAALLLLGPVRPDGGVRLVGVVGEEGRDRNAGAVHAARRGRRPPPSPSPASRRPTRGVRPREAFEPGEGTVGRPRARGARATASRSGRRPSARGSSTPTKSVRKAFAWAVGLNWYPEPEHQAGRRLRADAPSPAGPRAARTARPRTPSSSAPRSPSERERTKP